VKIVWTGLAIVVALLLQTALGRILPSEARILDPFLLILVYCALTGGETHGMLAGAVGGWVQDVHFGGTVVGLSGLAKLLVGFGVGAAAARFLFSGPLPRLLVLVSATLVDALLFSRLAGVFDIVIEDLSPRALLARAVGNGLVGLFLFEVVDRRLRRDRRP
jgi:rod shape-determining protein MreD